MMLNEKILTISIAAYNMEKYIRQCLDSLIVEEIIGDIEVFVIDDGGTDDTLSIAKEYENKYPGSIYAIHKDNEGYGTTVNYSIEHSRGKYFKILDGDDYFDRDCFYKLVRYLKTVDDDVVFNGRYHVYNDKRKLQHALKVENNCFDEVLKRPLLHIHTITVKTDILKQYMIRLPGKILYTDTILSCVFFSYVSTASTLDLPVYSYRLNREGQSVEKRQLVRHLQDQIAVEKILIDHYLSVKDGSGKNAEIILKRVAMICRRTYKIILYQKNMKKTISDIKQHDSDIKSYSMEIYDEIESWGKMGLIIKIMRETNFRTFWIFKLLCFIQTLNPYRI